MEWLKLRSNFADDPKVLDLSDKAFRAYVTGLCYAARHETDGMFPVSGKPQEELVGAGLVIKLNEGKVATPTWSKHNRTRAQMDAKRIAGRNAAAIRWGNTEPNTEVEVEEEVEVDKPLASPTAKRRSGNPSHDTIYLAERINEAWGATNGGRLTPAGLQRFVTEYGAREVEDAVRELYGFPPGEAVQRPHAYLESMLKARREEASS